MIRVHLVWLTLVSLMLATACAEEPALPQEYSDFQQSFISLPADTEVSVGTLFKMKLRGTFLWVTKGEGPTIPHTKPLFNSCTKISGELTGHDKSIALVEITVCNINGEYYYRVPITS